MHTHVLHIHFHLNTWFVHTASHTAGTLIIRANVQYCYLIENCLSWNNALWCLLTVLSKRHRLRDIFYKFLRCKQWWFTEHPFVLNATLVIPPPQSCVIYKVIFKAILDPNTYYKNASTTVQKLNNRTVLVKSSMSQPLTSSCIYVFLLPCAVSSFNPYTVLIHIQAGHDWLQHHTPYANALCKLKACLNIWNGTIPNLFVA